MLYLNTVSNELLEIAKTVTALPEIMPFRMVGGTALALQIGHRESVDIDFFCNEKRDKSRVATALQKKFPNEAINTSEYRVYGIIHGVKVELFDDWHTPFIHEPVIEEGFRLASLLDIASLKLDAIVERREKKDYIDLYFLFNRLGAETILDHYRKSNPFISQQSIVFALGEVNIARTNKSVMPKMMVDVSWNEVEKTILEVAKENVPKNQNRSN